MRLLKILCCLLFVCCGAFAQNTRLDSLLTELKSARQDSARVKLLNNTAGEYIAEDAVKGREYATQALRLAERLKMPLQQALALINLGNANIMQSKYPQAIQCFNDSRIISEQLYKSKPTPQVIDALAMAYGSIGVVCNEQNNFPKALEYFFKALKLYRQSHQNDIVARIYSGIAVVYKSQKEYEKALKYFKSSLQYLDKNDKASIGTTYTGIGSIYLKLGRETEALQAFNTAKDYLNESDDARAYGELYNSFGDFYRQKQQYGTARQHYENALEYFNRSGYTFGLSATYEYLGRIAEAEGNSKTAADYYAKSIAAANETGSLSQVRDSEKALSELYEKQGNTGQSFIHYKNYVAANDSLVNTENIKALVSEEMNFEFERKEAQRKLEIEKKQVLYKEQVKRHTILMVFAIVLGIVLTGLAFVIYNRRQIKKNLTLQRDLAEYEQKALHLQMNPHFVFNCLGAISGFIVQNGTDSAIKYLSKFSKLMRLTLEYSKESLIPIDKEVESLQNYLELEQLRFNHIFDFEIIKENTIEDDMALPPLLIQPFVENAIIHGIVPKKERGQISVRFRAEGNNLICFITDNGIGVTQSKGLKENSVTVHKSMALEITRKRLEVIEAYTARRAGLKIEDNDTGADTDKGTKITLTLPIQYLSGNS